MTLAPVGTPAEAVHDLLDEAEVRLVLHGVEDVHGDVTGVAPVRRREQGVVAGAEADLDRERDREVMTLDGLAHGAYGVSGPLPRDRVLHLGESHAARRDE